MSTFRSGNQIRKEFLEFFAAKGHTVVPSASLVPGGDSTLLFTNSGMVQFKGVFLGLEDRPYVRAVDSQKCMRVAGKHNDLDDVGRDDTHHTFFEMLGNWSFGDYYKKEAITWAWELLTNVWGIDKGMLWATYFVDDEGQLPPDEEARDAWVSQPGFIKEHAISSGRKDNLWEMAETGPCGPCSEIHIDRGEDACIMKDVPGHVCEVTGNCKRFIELWNLVFIQYNRISPLEFIPLPKKHVDTGMGFERIVAILQDKTSNYRTDLLWDAMLKIQEVSGQSTAEMEANITPYRVITDHSRAAAFLIADGVIPGNTGRNYITRMIIRRASLFGRKLGITREFLAEIADVIIQEYKDAYPELENGRSLILSSINDEEIRFQRTVEEGIEYLDEVIAGVKNAGGTVISGAQAFELYATHGLPYELTKDVALEYGLSVDREGFVSAFEEHKNASGAGKSMGTAGGDEVELYKSVFEVLVATGKIKPDGVQYDPYGDLNWDSVLAAIVKDGESVSEAMSGDKISIVLPETNFYVESGGQIADAGKIVSDADGEWEIEVTGTKRPASGIVALIGEVVRGRPTVGDRVRASIDVARRQDIMRNHTATHLLHAALHHTVGANARQAGSLVAPDRLRFDFTNPTALTAQQISQIENYVNEKVLENLPVAVMEKDRDTAMSEGAMALFGEKYGNTVRTVTIQDDDKFSYELCGGTHVAFTGEIGHFYIVSEGSIASGIRRIEAITGREAYKLAQHRNGLIKQASAILETGEDAIPSKVSMIYQSLVDANKEISLIKQQAGQEEFKKQLQRVKIINGVEFLYAVINEVPIEQLRAMTDQFKNIHPNGVIVLGSEIEGKPMIVAAIADMLVKAGWNAGDLVKTVAPLIGGSGGGRPQLAQAGGKDSTKLPVLYDAIQKWITEHK